MFDGLGYYQTGDLDTYFDTDTRFYHVENNGYPQSASVHDTLLTGRDSRNYVGGQLYTDTVVDQFQLEQKKKKTIGSFNSFPVPKLLGEDRFKEMKTHNGRERAPLTYITDDANCREPFKEDFDSAERIDKNLTETIFKYQIAEISDIYLFEDLNPAKIMKCFKRHGVFRKNKNFLYHSTIMDSSNHNYAFFSHKALHRASALIAGVKGIVQGMKEMNQTYVLIVSSDHGGQWYLGEDELCNHGCKMSDGNEAILFIYSEGIGKQPEEE